MKKLTPKQEEEHLNATHCFLCDEEFSENEKSSRKHCDHCHVTGEYHGAACQHCNLDNLSLKGLENIYFFIT